MRIVLPAYQLAHYGGLESYVLCAGQHLQRLGHDVVVWSREQGAAAAQLRERGLAVAPPEAPPRHADAVLAADGVSALEAAAALPGVPQALVVHGETSDGLTPPMLPGLVGALVCLHGRTARWAGALAVGTPVVRLRQPIDVDRFAPRGPVHVPPRRVLALGHYLSGPRLDALERACATAGAELEVLGRHTRTTAAPEHAIAGADVVVGKGRVVLEAMACGRPAYVYDHNGGEGWVTAESYARLEEDNFGGQSRDGEPVHVDRLAADLPAADPADGAVGRELAVRHHAGLKHAAALVEVLEGLAAPSGPPADVVAELARLHRIALAHEWRARSLGDEVDRLRRVEDALQADRVAQAAELQRVGAEYQRLSAEHAVLGAQAREQAAAEG